MRKCCCCCCCVVQHTISTIHDTGGSYHCLILSLTSSRHWLGSVSVRLFDFTHSLCLSCVCLSLSPFVSNKTGSTVLLLPFLLIILAIFILIVITNLTIIIVIIIRSLYSPPPSSVVVISLRNNPSIKSLNIYSSPLFDAFPSSWFCLLDNAYSQASTNIKPSKTRSPSSPPQYTSPYLLSST